jgi:hypothetical protein
MIIPIVRLLKENFVAIKPPIIREEVASKPNKKA